MGKRLRAAACGLVPLACLAFSHCALLFPVGGLDSDRDSGDEAGSNLVDAPVGDAADAESDAQLDGNAGEGSETAREAAGDDGRGVDGDALVDAPDGSLDSPAAPDAPGACADGSAGPTGQVAFTFGAIENVGWEVNPSSGPNAASINWTPSEGKTCHGALTMIASFTGYDGDSSVLQYLYGSGASWSSGSSRLHAWVKLEPQTDGGVDPFTTLGNVGIFVRSHSNSNYTFFAVNVMPSFSDGAWHELVLDLSLPEGGPAGRNGPDVDRTSIQALGAFVSAGTTRPSGAPSVPPPVMLLLDDVWLE